MKRIIAIVLLFICGHIQAQVVTPKAVLKTWFETADKPTQEQYYAWMDSYWHKDELLPVLDTGYSRNDSVFLVKGGNEYFLYSGDLGATQIDSSQVTFFLDSLVYSPPPGAPDGSRFLIGKPATGGFAGRDNMIAYKIAGVYSYDTAKRIGDIAAVANQEKGANYKYTGTYWKLTSQPFVNNGGRWGTNQTIGPIDNYRLNLQSNNVIAMWIKNRKVYINAFKGASSRAYYRPAADGSFDTGSFSLQAGIDPIYITDSGATAIRKTFLDSVRGGLFGGSSGGGASAFTALSDVPHSYSGNALKLLRVNSGATGLEFFTPNYILPADTASMLSPYLRSNVAAATYVSLTGSYVNPAWISSLAWSKITGTPTTLSGYGITDAITSGVINGPGVLYNTPTTATVSSNTLTFAPTLKTQSANTFLAGPASGAAAMPVFRTLTAADIPTLAYEPSLGNPSTNGYILSSTAAGVRSWIAPPSGGGGSYTAGRGLALSGSQFRIDTLTRLTYKAGMNFIDTTTAVIPAVNFTKNTIYSGSTVNYGAWFEDSSTTTSGAVANIGAVFEAQYGSPNFSIWAKSGSVLIGGTYTSYHNVALDVYGGNVNYSTAYFTNPANGYSLVPNTVFVGNTSYPSLTKFDNSGSGTGGIVFKGNVCSIEGIGSKMHFVGYSYGGGDLRFPNYYLTFDGSTGNIGINNSSPSFPLDVNGKARANGFVRKSSTVTSSTTLTNSYSVWFINSSSSTTQTLPSASLNTDFEITVRNISTGNITVSGVISGDANSSIAGGVAVTYHSDGTNWYSISKN